MSTLHDMVEQQIPVVLVAHGNTSTFILFLMDNEVSDDAQARLSLG